ncbi:MAG: DUF1254 domain-containing protein [Syntrophobacteraceae bacterium]|jgi:hypothetical protein
MSGPTASSGRVFISAVVLTAVLLVSTASWAQAPSAAEARAIARQAYVYGFPMVDNYRIIYDYFVNAKSPEYKAPFNTIKSMARVYTPEDKAVQTPNSDTPYSLLGLDLRAEPMVLTVPAIEKGRYFSLQFVDAYTFNFDYVGSRTTGNGGGSFLVVGPGWKGETPKGIARVLRSETDFALVIYRTQLFNPGDLENVEKIQADYKAQPLSAFLRKIAPQPAAAVSFIQPLSPADQKTSLEFFNILNFVIQFCPAEPSEKELMARFAEIGIGMRKKFDAARLSPELKKAFADGMADAWKKLDDFQKTSIDTGKVTSGDLFGSRVFLKNNYLYRFAGAVLGIYGNSKQEAMYPIYKVDAEGRDLDASGNSYTLRFAPDRLPPVNAFWSLTMYELPSSLLVANPLNRYLINSPMLSGLKRDADGSLTIYIQHESPGQDRESNWLPAPNGAFMAVLRLYWPKKEALDGGWKAPPLQRVQ